MIGPVIRRLLRQRQLVALVRLGLRPFPGLTRRVIGVASRAVDVPMPRDATFRRRLPRTDAEVAARLGHDARAQYIQLTAALSGQAGDRRAG